MTPTTRRRRQRIWTFTERLHIPVPSSLKADVRRLARESGVSISAWGFGIVQTAVANPEWLAAAMDELATLSEGSAE